MEKMITVKRVKVDKDFTGFFKQITSCFSRTNATVILYRLDIIPSHKKFSEITDDDVVITKRFNRDMANRIWWNIENNNIGYDNLINALIEEDLI